MRLIAHRGNVLGPNPERENHPLYLFQALKLGFDIELDIWHEKGVYWLGHDKPQWQVDPWAFPETRTWYHCKNLAALERLSWATDTRHLFFHDKDDYTFTSTGYVWCFPGKEPPFHHAVSVVRDLDELPRMKPDAICSDWVALLSGL